MRFTHLFSIFACVALLAGCNSYNLRYSAQPQPSGANLFADYTSLQDSVGVSIDTDGRRLEEIYVKKADGTIVRPVNIAYPGFGKSSAVGSGVGFGTGNVAFGTGIGFPVGREEAHGLTTATFTTAALSTAPWELHVKVEGVPEAIIPGLGGPPTAK